MSTRTSLYYWSNEPDKLAFQPAPEEQVHVYREMHDAAIHLYITDGTNSEVNVVLPKALADVLLARLRSADLEQARRDGFEAGHAALQLLQATALEDARKEWIRAQWPLP